MQKIIIILIIVVDAALNSVIFSQDTTKKKIDTTFKPITFIISENKHNYINPIAPDTITRKRFLWYPLKSIDDIFNYLPGYYLRSMDVGQVNQLTFNQLDNYSTGVLRHGRPINDLIDGSIDLNLLSRNEISEIEVSNGFGNSIYNYSNTVNIIQRQQFQFRPYTELAFWQDRYDNEFIDAYFSQNFFNGFNFNFGATKHSYSGKYTHSYFDKWLGRFNFNFAPSKKLNFFLYTNYAKIDRGLNEGISSDAIDINNKETVFNPTLAVVVNPDAYENRERFDADGGVLVSGNNSLTRLQVFTSNSFRQYRDPDYNGIYLKYNTHWIDYGAKIQQQFMFNPSKQVNLTSSTELEYNYDLLASNFFSITSSKRFYILQKAGVNIKNLSVNPFVKIFKHEYYSNRLYFDYGINAGYKIRFDSLNCIEISGSYQKINKIPFYQNYFLVDFYSDFNTEQIQGSIRLNSKFGNVSASVTHYRNKYNLTDQNYIRFETGTTNLNVGGNLRIYKFDIEGSYGQVLKYPDDTSLLYYNKLFPEYTGSVSVSFHDMGIKNKLEYKIGFTSRMWTTNYPVYYSGIYNQFSTNFGQDSIYHSIPANATLFFFIIGKINKAVFGLTFENILDRLVYNTGVYPAIDRGGLFNALSRFNITWYFFD